MGLEASTLALIGAGLSTAGTVTGSLIARNKSQKTPQISSINNLEVAPNDEAALRNAQDAARRRRGVSANILTDGSGSTAGAVASKTLLGQ